MNNMANDQYVKRGEHGRTCANVASLQDSKIGVACPGVKTPGYNVFPLQGNVAGRVQPETPKGGS